MTTQTSRRAVTTSAVLIAATLAVASCTGVPASPHAAGEGMDCPPNDLVTSIGVDVTGSHHSAAVKASNMEVIAQHVRRTATCEGTVSVFAFASSTGATVPIFDGDLSVEAPTENAKQRKAEKLAEQTMATISANYDAALANITGSGTDIIGMLSLFQQKASRYPDTTAHHVLLTDGLQNVDVDPTNATSVEAAQALADQQRVPDLSGAELTIVGIGRQAQGELPSTVIENVTAFWERICQNTHAATCRVSTDGQ